MGGYNDYMVPHDTLPDILARVTSSSVSIWQTSAQTPSPTSMVRTTILNLQVHWALQLAGGAELNNCLPDETLISGLKKIVDGQ